MKHVGQARGKKKRGGTYARDEQDPRTPAFVRLVLGHPIIRMRIRENQSARRARVSEQTGLDVGLLERRLQEGVGAEEDLGGGEVVGDTLVCEEGIDVDVLRR